MLIYSYLFEPKVDYVYQLGTDARADKVLAIEYLRKRGFSPLYIGNVSFCIAHNKPSDHTRAMLTLSGVKIKSKITVHAAKHNEFIKGFTR